MHYFEIFTSKNAYSSTISIAKSRPLSTTRQEKGSLSEQRK